MDTPPLPGRTIKKRLFGGSRHRLIYAAPPGLRQAAFANVDKLEMN